MARVLFRAFASLAVKGTLFERSFTKVATTLMK